LRLFITIVTMQKMRTQATINALRTNAYYASVIFSKT